MNWLELTRKLDFFTDRYNKQPLTSEQEQSSPTKETKTDPFEHIRHFFDDSEFDPFTKKTRGPESYALPGEPCHGGYATESDREEYPGRGNAKNGEEV